MTTLIHYLKPTEETEWIACMFAVKHSEYDHIKSRLFHYLPKGELFIISKEIADGSHKHSNGEHIHICARMTSVIYGNMSENITRKYKLRGKAGDGEPRKYGKVQGIRQIDLMCAYVLKDGEYETNIAKDRLDELLALSHTKTKNEIPKKIDVRKQSKSWSQRVVEELTKNQEISNKKWCHHRDKHIIADMMLIMLGKQAKKFNRGLFRDMYWGIYNALPKEGHDHNKILESMLDSIDDHI
jgi:hypothetical protein